MAEVRFEEHQELPHIALIGFACRGTLPTLRDEMRKPSLDSLFEIVAERKLGVSC